MSRFRTNLTGFQASVRGLNEAKKKTLAQFQTGMKRLAEDIFRRSQYYCPVSVDGSYGNPPGYLRDSAEVRMVGPMGRGFTAGNYGNWGLDYVVGYGLKYPVFYAAYVHEIPANHEAPTKDKYLEDAVREVVQERGNAAFGGNFGFDVRSETGSVGDEGRESDFFLIREGG